MSYSLYHSNPLIDLCTAIKSLLTLMEENVHDNAITWTRRINN